MGSISSKIASVRWHVNRTPLAWLTKKVKAVPILSKLKKRKAFAAQVDISDQAKEKASKLRSMGFVEVTDLISQDDLRALLHASQEKLTAKHDKSLPATNQQKRFWTNLLGSSDQPEQRNSDDPFVRPACGSKLLQCLVDYYKTVPRLDYVLLTHSIYTETEFSISQLWHKDHDDTNVVKLFIYLSDVTSKDGPFTFFDKPTSAPFKFSIKSHQSDQNIKKRLSIDDFNRKKIQMIRPKLTAFLVNFSQCLHMGSRVDEGHERLMYTATYITSPRIFPEGRPNFLVTSNDDKLVTALLSID